MEIQHLTVFGQTAAFAEGTNVVVVGRNQGDKALRFQEFQSLVDAIAITDEYVIVVWQDKSINYLSADFMASQLKLSHSVTHYKKVSSAAAAVDKLVFADKFGEVFVLPHTPGSEAVYATGHFTPITLIKLTAQDILTADKDFKIHRCDYEKPEMIKQVLMGHRTAIADMTIVKGNVVSLDNEGNGIVWGEDCYPMMRLSLANSFGLGTYANSLLVFSSKSIFSFSPDSWEKSGEANWEETKTYAFHSTAIVEYANNQWTETSISNLLPS